MKRREKGSSGQKSISPKSTESAKENRGREINMENSLKWKQKDRNRKTEIENRNRKQKQKNRNRKQKQKNRNKKQKHRKTESESCRTQFISSNQIRSSKNETIS